MRSSISIVLSAALSLASACKKAPSGKNVGNPIGARKSTHQFSTHLSKTATHPPHPPRPPSSPLKNPSLTHPPSSRPQPNRPRRRPLHHNMAAHIPRPHLPRPPPRPLHQRPPHRLHQRIHPQQRHPLLDALHKPRARRHALRPADHRRRHGRLPIQHAVRHLEPGLRPQHHYVVVIPKLHH